MHLLVTAGPTREFLDPVRFLSNRSTGKMGWAIAEEGISRGWEVTLVAGPVALPPPDGLARFVPVVSARDLLAALRARIAEADVLVMTAAVADFRPARRAARKIRKGAMPEALRLVRNPDILTALRPRKGNRLFVGFAAETDDVLGHAAGKLARKGLDLIVANDVTRPGAGFGTDTNIVTILSPDAEPEPLPLLSKRAVAARLLDRIEERVAARTAPPKQ